MRLRLGDHPYAKELASLGLPKRALVSSSAANVDMTFGDAQEILWSRNDFALTETGLDVDLTDGNFYADGGARAAYAWMRANQPVFRDRNGLAAAASYQAVLDAERNPELFSSTGGIRPEQPGMPYMIDMDDPRTLLRRKLVNSGFTRKRVMDKVPSIERLCDTLIDACLRARRVRLRPRHRRAAADGGHRRHARGAARGTRNCC